MREFAAESGSETIDVAALVERFTRDGYVLLPGVVDAARVEAMRTTLDALRAQIGSPPVYSREPVRTIPKTEISSTGLVFFELLGWAPHLAPMLLDPAPLAVVRAILGDDARMELVGAVMTDETRAFFEWHNHVGGPDDEQVRLRGGNGPSARRPQRLSYLVYLDDATDTNGPMLVLPGRPTDPTAPPFPTDQAHWPGEVTVTFAAGSVLLIDETTWHAVPQRHDVGPRRWVGAYFAAGYLPHSEMVDGSLAAIDDPLVRSVVR